MADDRTHLEPFKTHRAILLFLHGASHVEWWQWPKSLQFIILCRKCWAPLNLIGFLRFYGFAQDRYKVSNSFVLKCVLNVFSVWAHPLWIHLLAVNVWHEYFMSIQRITQLYAIVEINRNIFNVLSIHPHG